MRQKYKHFRNPIQLCGYFLPKGVGVGVGTNVNVNGCLEAQMGCKLYQEGSDSVLVVVLQMAQ